MSIPKIVPVAGHTGLDIRFCQNHAIHLFTRCAAEELCTLVIIMHTHILQSNESFRKFISTVSDQFNPKEREKGPLNR